MSDHSEFKWVMLYNIVVVVSTVALCISVSPWFVLFLVIIMDYKESNPNV